ncbi:MAG TPA: VIT1/CCC1 transporter family protein [Vicinamibacterales bacterium]|nr:VIT1/CCC1 transporter family protein [Vicinamibacterales bacterium]
MDHYDHVHTPEAISLRLSEGTQHSYLRDWVYGGIDGAVTTFAVVAGVAGAELGARVILILGAANLVADGFSMAASNFVGTRTERDQLQRAAAVERRHIESDPEGEREEVRQIFSRKGLTGATLEAVVEELTSEREKWVRTMVTEEYGLPREVRSPVLAALATFSAFAVCGFVPLLPFVFGMTSPLAEATILTALVFLGIGSLKGVVAATRWWYSAVETLVIGAAAAAVAFLIGIALKSVT